LTNKLRIKFILIFIVTDLLIFSSSMTGEAEGANSGHIVIDEGETFIIENKEFLLKGKLYVNGTLIMRNSTLSISNYKDSWIFVQKKGRIILENSVMDLFDPNRMGTGIDLYDESQMIMLNSEFYGTLYLYSTLRMENSLAWGVSARRNSTVWVRKSRIDLSISDWEANQKVHIEDSNVSLSYVLYTNATIKNIKPGAVNHWRSSIFNMTLRNSVLEAFEVVVEGSPFLTIMNSTITKLGVMWWGGVSPIVTLVNTTVYLLKVGHWDMDTSQVFLSNSSYVSKFSPYGKVGLAISSDSWVRDILARRYPTFTPSFSYITKEFLISAKYSNGSAARNAMVDLYSDGLLLFNSTTDLQGNSILKLTFTTKNVTAYTTLYKAIVHFGDYFAVVTFNSFLHTPLVVTLLKTEISQVTLTPEVPTYDESAIVSVQVSGYVKSVTLHYKVNHNWISIPMTRNGSVFEAEIPAYAYGKTIDYKIKVLDEMGKQTESQVYSYTVSDEILPSLVINSPTNDGFIFTNKVTVTWAGFDAGSDIDHYEVRLDDGLWINVGTNTSYTFDKLNDGDHIVYIRAVDKAGNSREEHVAFTTLCPWINWWFWAIIAIIVFTAAFFVLRRMR